MGLRNDVSDTSKNAIKDGRWKPQRQSGSGFSFGDGREGIHGCENMAVLG